MSTAVLDGTWDSLKKIAVRHLYQPHTVLFQQGDPVPAVFLIERGIVKILRWEDTDQPVVVGVRYSGWVLGAASVVNGVPQFATAETYTACALWMAPAGLFLDVVMTDSILHLTVHRMHIRELADQLSRLAGLGALSAERRLGVLLREFCELEDHRQVTSNGIRLKLPFSQAELAELIFTSREHVNRLLKVLEDKHLIRREKGWIIVPDPAALRPHV